MNEPVMHKPTWTVWTHDAIYQTYPSGPMSALWCWSAHGPRGSQSGAEPTADAAAMKAQCAMLVLSNDGPKKVGA